MKTTIEVLERMGEIVVHVRHHHGVGPQDYEQQTVVLDEQSAVALCGQVGAVLARRRTAVAPVEVRERWYRVSARAGDNPRTTYVRATNRGDAHRLSALAKLHEAEVRVECMADDFCPPNGRSK